MSVDPTFEVIRFQVAPAGNDVAVIELEGRPTDPGTLGGRIQLLLENPVERLELRPTLREGDHGSALVLWTHRHQRRIGQRVEARNQPLGEGVHRVQVLDRLAAHR